MSYQTLLPRILQSGGGAVNELNGVLRALSVKRPLVVTDHMMEELGYLQRIKDLLSQAGVPHGVFADTVPEPTESSIVEGVHTLQAGLPDGRHFDSVIALGGGSPIDSAKAISVLGPTGGRIRDYRFPNEVEPSGLPVVAIPTTAGTGSEATRFTIITDDKVGEKMLCGGLGFMPMAALVDFELTLSVPPRVTADTGVDALTHAMEAYVSRKAHPFSDQQALAAMRLIAPNLRRVWHEPDDRTAREAMMMGSTLGGMAFSNASVALVHGMSRPIGAAFHVPHGLSNAMLLPAVTEFSIPAAPERYAECARAMGVANASDNTATANDKLLAELNALNRTLEVPDPKAYGIERTRYQALTATMAEQALASGSPGNNPRVPDVDEIMALYEQVWHQASSVT